MLVGISDLIVERSILQTAKDIRHRRVDGVEMGRAITQRARRPDSYSARILALDASYPHREAGENMS